MYESFILPAMIPKVQILPLVYLTPFNYTVYFQDSMSLKQALHLFSADPAAGSHCESAPAFGHLRR